MTKESKNINQDLKDSIDAVDELSEEIKEKIHKTARATKNKTEEVVQNTQEKIAGIQEEIVSYIKENPWKSMGICIVAGMLVSQFLNRK